MAARKIQEILEGGTGLPPNPTIDIPSPTIVIPVDEYHGMGGSYIFDPETGKRTPTGMISTSTGTATETTNEEIAHESQ